MTQNVWNLDKINFFRLERGIANKDSVWSFFVAYTLVLKKMNWEKLVVVSLVAHVTRSYVMVTAKKIYLLSNIIWATSWQNLLLPYANNKGADQRLCFSLLR